MRVQHPEKRQHVIEPKGEGGALPLIETDDEGVADVEDTALAKSLLDQGWTEVKGSKSAPEKEK